MGSGGSTPRKIEVENDGNVIRVSDAVVDRLKGNKPELRAQEPNQTIVYNAPYAPLGAVTSLDVKRIVEEEIVANDKYWTERLVKLQESNRSIDEIMKREYYQAIKEIEAMYPERNIHKKPPCEDVKKNILKCYKENISRSLACSPEVLKFQNCLVNKVY